jgi:hypothetical protein
MIPFTDKQFNNLKWKAIHVKKLDQTIQGMEVLGAEAVNYPLTDGITIYLKSKDGKTYALDISADFGEKTPVSVQIAQEPEY